jgi:hypothetical protein
MLISQSRSKIGSPVEYFSDWAYQIDPWHWVVLGVTRELFRKDKEVYVAYVQGDVDLSEYTGTVFYKLGSGRSGNCLQIIAVLDQTFVEVHEINVSRTAYMVSTGDFLIWLQAGVRPNSAYTIAPAQSKSQIMFM